MAAARQPWMRGSAGALTLLAALSALPCHATAPASDDRLVVGVNRVNMAWLEPTQSQTIVDQMKAAGVRNVRISLSEPFGKGIRVAEMFAEAGIGILLEIPLGTRAFYPPDAIRTGHGRIWDIPRLSRIDLDIYRERFGTALADLAARSVPIIAVEVGNELNWAPYNGDLIVHPRDGEDTASGIQHLADRDAFLRGLDRYVDVLRITRTALREQGLYADTKLISAGTADVTEDIADHRGMERVAPKPFIQALVDRGMDELVDGYGVHVYPDRTRPAEQQRENLRDAVAPCATAKPCWVTEWGAAEPDQSCSGDDSGRLQRMRTARRAFEQMFSEGRVDAIYAYDWDSKSQPHALWRCGGLTPSGHEALR